MAIAKEIDEVDNGGGIVEAISTGRIQEAISRQAYARELAIQKGETPKVGVNCYRKEEEARSVEFHPYNEENARRQVENLTRVKVKRDTSEVARCLAIVKEDAQRNVNLMPSIIEAVKAYATVGEITQTLKDVYGEYDEPIYF